MLEDYEESFSLTRRTRNLKKALGMLERNWKHQLLPLCLARHARKVRKGWRSICLYQVKMEDAPKLMLQNYWKITNRNVQTFGFVYQDTNGLNHGPVWKTRSFLLSEIYMVILWQDCYGKVNLRKSFWNTVGRRFPIVNAYSYTVKKGYSYLCMWMTSSWLERNKTLIRCGKYLLNKEVDLGEPTSFLDHVYLECTQRQNEKSKDIVDNYRTMFESRISARSTEKWPCSENLSFSLHGPKTWKVMPSNVWDDIVSWQTRRLNNSTK